MPVMNNSYPATPVEAAIRRGWNYSDIPEEAAAHLVRLTTTRGFFVDYSDAMTQCTRRFAVYRRHLGIAPFPVHAQQGCFSDATGVVPFQEDFANMSPQYLAWRGITGPGKVLRDLLAQ